VNSRDPAAVLKTVSDSLGQAMSEARSLTFDLSFPILQQLGFEAAVEAWVVGHIQGKFGTEMQFHDDGQPKPLDDDVRILLFRNVRELLMNVVKHAKAKKVKVSIRRASRQIQVSVEDNGVGFDPAESAAKAVKTGAFGLFSIRERLEELGGALEIESEPGRGTRVTMRAPVVSES
jgi:signal transduction histidine kinase